MFRVQHRGRLTITQDPAWIQQGEHDTAVAEGGVHGVWYHSLARILASSILKT